MAFTVPSFRNFWQSMWSPIRTADGTRRDVGLQIAAPFTYGTQSAVPVTEDTAVQLSAVWACVRLLAETVASMPVKAYKKTDKGRVEVEDHWFIELLETPNQYMTQVEFLETLMLNLALHGNAYCQVETLAGRVRSLLPLMTAQMQTRLLSDGSVVHYYFYAGDVKAFASDSIWHTKLFGNGIIGKSPLAFARNTMGIGQAAEQSVSNVYTNGGKRSGVLSIDKLLTPEQRTAIRQNFATLTTGDDTRLLVLEAGMTFDGISMSPQDIELLASRRFQIEEICRFFGVPSVLINDTAGSTTWGSGIQQIVDGFYRLSLRPYLERLEASIERYLLGAGEEDIEIEFDFDSLLRSDITTRFEAYRTGIQGSILTPNEARAMEGLPKQDGGDVLLAQINMSPLDKLGKEPPKPQPNLVPKPTGGQENVPNP